MLTNLPTDEAMLLLYLAEELSPADRAQVEHKLAGNGQLKAQLEELRRLDELVKHRIEAEENGQIDVERAIGKAQAALREASSARLSDTAQAPVRKLPLPWWMYPLAAAASILVAAAIFIANISPKTLPPPANLPMGEIVNSDIFIEPQMTPTEAYAIAEDLASSFDDSDQVLANAGSNRLLAAARELDEIRNSSQVFGDMVMQ